MRIHGLLLAFSATVLLAQGPGRAGMMGPGVQGRPAVEAVKAALELSDAQVQQLVQLQQEEQQVLQPLRQQAQEKRKALQQAREAANPNPTTVGQLVLDLQKLAGQIQTVNQTFHTKALDLLDATQKEKLQTLEEVTERAMRARQAANGARALNLLLPPVRGQRLGL
jgi:Spy/CpxP family protein refolding chaperone